MVWAGDTWDIWPSLGYSCQKLMVYKHGVGFLVEFPSKTRWGSVD